MSPPFADDVVSFTNDHQCVLWHFVVECEATGMRICASKSEVVVQKKGDLPSVGTSISESAMSVRFER